MRDSTLKSRLRPSLIERGEAARWQLVYKPTTVAFDPSMIIELPSLGGGSNIPHDFAAMAANMIAAVDCESEVYHDRHPGFAGLIPRRSKRDIFEEVIEILYAGCFVRDEDGKIEALAAFAA